MWPKFIKFPSLILLLTLFGILLSAFTYVLYKQNRIGRERDQQVILSYEILRSARLIYSGLVNMETGERGYLLSGNKEFLQPYVDGEISLENAYIRTQSLMAASDKESHAQFETVRPKLDRMKVLLADHMDRYERSKQKPGRQFALTMKDMYDTKEAMDDFRAAIDEFIARENFKLHRSLAAAHQQQIKYSWILLIGGIALFGTLLFANVLLLAVKLRASRAEKDLHNLKEGYQLMIEGMNDGVFDYDPTNGQMIFSPSHERLLGYKPSELPNRVETINNLLHPDDFNSAWETANKYFRQETPSYSATFRLLHKNGNWRWILARGVGVWDEEGNIRRIVGIHTDITPQKQREEDLRQLNSELESFTYIASHDLRGPLINIKGFSGEISYMLNQVKPKLESAMAALPESDQKAIADIFDQEIPEALTFIESAVDKMDKLTTALLDLSRIGRRDHKIEEVDTDHLVRETVNSLAYEISKKNITVEYQDLPKIYTDEVALQQIIGNILDNAVKFMDPSRPGHITVRAELTLGAYEFTIADNGMGIRDIDKKKIFDIFRRGSNAKDTRGLGMGMAYVKATLRRLGGRVWFTSVPGEGTTFHFTLPYDALKEVL